MSVPKENTRRTARVSVPDENTRTETLHWLDGKKSECTLGKGQFINAQSRVSSLCYHRDKANDYLFPIDL